MIWKDYEPQCYLCDEPVSLGNYKIIGERDTRKEITNVYVHKNCIVGDTNGKENNNDNRG